jgi:hypothetical protein
VLRKGRHVNVRSTKVLIIIDLSKAVGIQINGHTDVFATKSPIVGQRKHPRSLNK